MLTAVAHHGDAPGAHVYNLGTDATVVVDDSVALITARMGLEPTIEKTGGTRGWAGDSPLIHLDTTKIQSLGWAPTLTIPEAIARTLDWFEAEPAIVLDQESISS
jgi:UDP-glucose 4-epimerase